MTASLYQSGSSVRASVIHLPSRCESGETAGRRAWARPPSGHNTCMAHAPVYLDYHATTPVDPRVLDAMLPFFTEHFGNAASSTHPWGWKAQAAVEAARKEI